MNVILALCGVLLLAGVSPAAEMPWVTLSDDGAGFVLVPGQAKFRPHGFNYDRDDGGRLIEDYWHDEWDVVAEDFGEMQAQGANVVRVHLQLGRFMDAADRPNERSLKQLARLLELSEKLGVYLNITGLGCYHKQDVPPWYDKLTEAERWSAQAAFWKEVAGVCRESPAVFCYNLMNEPVVPGAQRGAGEWLGGAFAGKHYVQFISLDAADRPRPAVAKAWIDQLAGAIRSVDDRHLITVGLVDWSLDRPGLTSGFVPAKCCQSLDFVSVHIYPEKGQVDAALKTLAGFAIGKPIVVEETYPLKCSLPEMQDFLKRGDEVAAGFLTFYWGLTIEELEKSSRIDRAIMARWLTVFAERAAAQ